METTLQALHSTPLDDHAPDITHFQDLLLIDSPELAGPPETADIVFTSSAETPPPVSNTGLHWRVTTLPTESMILYDPSFRTYNPPSAGSIKHAKDITMWSRVDCSPAKHPFLYTDNIIAKRFRALSQTDNTTYWATFVILCNFYPGKTLEATIAELKRVLRSWGAAVHNGDFDNFTLVLNEALVSQQSLGNYTGLGGHQ